MDVLFLLKGKSLFALCTDIRGIEIHNIEKNICVFVCVWLNEVSPTLTSKTDFPPETVNCRVGDPRVGVSCPAGPLSTASLTLRADHRRSVVPSLSKDNLVLPTQVSLETPLPRALLKSYAFVSYFVKNTFCRRTAH